MFEPDDVKVEIDKDKNSELYAYDPHYSVGIVVESPSSIDKMYFMITDEGVFKVVSFDKEGNSHEHSFSLLDGAKLVYLLQRLIGSFVELYQDGVSEQQENN